MGTPGAGELKPVPQKIEQVFVLCWGTFVKVPIACVQLGNKEAFAPCQQWQDAVLLSRACEILGWTIAKAGSGKNGDYKARGLARLLMSSGDLRPYISDPRVCVVLAFALSCQGLVL